MKRTLKIILLGAVLSLSLSNSVYAEGEKLIYKNKIWKVTFSDKVDINTVEGKVYVIDESGKKIYLDGAVGENSNEALFLPPKDGYKSGGKYVLHIETGVKSRSGKSLGDKHSMNFSVEKETQIPEENYDAVTVNITQYDSNQNMIKMSNGYMIDDKIIGKIDLMQNTSKIEIAFENGDIERVDNFINWDNQNKLFTFRYNEKGFQSIQSKSSAHINWLMGKLNLTNDEIIYDNLIEKNSLTLGEIKGQLFKDGSIATVQERVEKYYSSQKVGGKTLIAEKILLEKDKAGKKINTYINFDNKNSKEILTAMDENNQDFESIKQWIARINNYVKNNFLDYTVEGKVMLTLDEQDVMLYFDASKIYYDSRSDNYYPKEPFITHININTKDYFIIRK